MSIKVGFHLCLKLLPLLVVHLQVATVATVINLYMNVSGKVFTPTLDP